MTLYIENNKLQGDKVQHFNTNKISGKMKPEYLVIHYTAGTSFSGDVRILSSSDAKVSCHIVIGENGDIAMIGNLNDIQWHAGKSYWKGVNGLNSHAIGIEVVNPGFVDFVRYENGGNVLVKHWTGKILSFPPDRLIHASHKNGGPLQYWIRFSEKQIEAILEVGSLLVKHYNLKEVVGHDDIAPRRKQDPGPACPENIFSRLNGRADFIPAIDTKTSVQNDLYVVNGTGKEGLNMRAWPSSSSKIIKILDEGDQVLYNRKIERWYNVTLVEENLTGWVHSSYLRKA